MKKINQSLLFGLIISMITIPGMAISAIDAEAKEKKEKEKKANEKFDEKCIKLFMKLKQSGSKIDKIEEKLIKEKCMEGQN